MAKKGIKRRLRNENYSKATKVSTTKKSSNASKLSSVKQATKRLRSSSRKNKLVKPSQTAGIKLKSNAGKKAKRELSSKRREGQRTKTKSVRKTKSIKKQVVLKKSSCKKRSSKRISNRNKLNSAPVKSKWKKPSPGCTKIKDKKPQTPLLKKFQKIVRKAKKATRSKKVSKSSKKKVNNKERYSSLQKSSRKSSGLKQLKKNNSKKMPNIPHSNPQRNSQVNGKRKRPVTRSVTRKRVARAKAKRLQRRNVKKRNPKPTGGVVPGKVIDLTETELVIDLTEPPKASLDLTESPKVSLPKEKEDNPILLNPKTVQCPKLKLPSPTQGEDSILASPTECNQPQSSSKPSSQSSSKPSSISDLSPICAIRKQADAVSHSNVITSTPKGDDNVEKVLASDTLSGRSKNLGGYVVSERTISTNEGFPTKLSSEEGKATSSNSVGFGPSLSTLAGFWRKNVRHKHPSSVSSAASTSEDTVDSLRHKQEREARLKYFEGQKRAIHRSGRMLSNKRTISRSNSGFQKRIRSGSWSGGPTGHMKRGDSHISPLNFKTSSNKRTLSSRRKSGSISITPAKTIAERIGFSAKKLKAPNPNNQEVRTKDETSASPLDFLPTLVSDR